MGNEKKTERLDPAIPINGFFELTQVVTGEFRNREEFLMKNISLGGFHLMSNYPPAIGNPYQIFVNYGEGRQEFRVRIVHSCIQRLQSLPESVLRAGVVYAIGCEIAFENDEQKNLVLNIIKNDCGYPPPTGSIH
jgi:hypothetical protein